MPQFQADCIRVTHPYDALGSVLLPNLPLVLHVLGLPLAFILSQDQTLHSINLYSNHRWSKRIQNFTLLRTSKLNPYVIDLGLI